MSRCSQQSNGLFSFINLHISPWRSIKLRFIRGVRRSRVSLDGEIWKGPLQPPGLRSQNKILRGQHLKSWGWPEQIHVSGKINAKLEISWIPKTSNRPKPYCFSNVFQVLFTYHSSSMYHILETHFPQQTVSMFSWIPNPSGDNPDDEKFCRQVASADYSRVGCHLAGAPLSVCAGGD